MESVTCEECGIEFEVQPHRANTAKYCSKNCQNVGRQIRETHICKECGDKYEVRPSEIDGETNFCSIECRSNYYSGENHHFWSGGQYVSEYGHEWPDIREKVIKRDETCQLCGDETQSGSTNKNDATVHHINPVSSFEKQEDAHYMENLILLCRTCHGVVEQSKEWTREKQKEDLLQ